MNPVRRATPDSEAVGSSEDERPWPSSMSFGKFPMKENSVPGMPGGIWATQKRGSFKISEAAQRNAARDAARMGAAAANGQGPLMRGASTPSPSVSEGASSLPFAIPLQPTPKTGRSLSHSQGQREAPVNSGSHLGAAPGPAAAAALPLGLLAEEDVDTDTESDVGSRLTHTTSHPPIGSLMRTATLPAAYDTMHSSNSGRDRQAAPHSPSHRDLMRARTFEAAFADLSMDHSHRRASQWQSSLGWDDVPTVNGSRRHSLADIPTRRGSLAGGEPSLLSRTYTHDVFETESPTSIGSAHLQGFPSDRAVDTNNDHNPASRNTETAHMNNYNIPAMYRAPTVQLQEHELRELERRGMQQATQNYYPGGNGGSKNSRKQLYIVSFKCSRVDVFFLLENTGLSVREGDLVIVEADRGQDLGTVQHANVTPEEARMLKKKYSEEQYKWLMMYSRNKEGGYNPNAQMNGEQQQLFPDAPTTMQGTIPRDTFNNLKPKAIKRLANDHEVKMLAEKEGNEAKAKRTCQQKVSHLRLQMEILDAEWQWDFQKLIFYYYADHYINFKDLITELYRIYKTRIWLSAINPASFSQHAMGQPPSGIGPGAVPPYALNNGYTMAYGEDRDPYGAQMPYRIPYETYNPNFPSIPGVANSFAPAALGTYYDYYGTGAPVAVTGGGAPRGIMPDARNEMLFYGRAGNDDYRQQAPRANNFDEASASGALVENSTSSGASGAAVRRQSAVLPPPIGTRRASQVDEFVAPASQHRARNPQFPSPFRNADPENRFFGRDGLYHAAGSNGNGNGYRAAPTQVYVGSPSSEQPPGYPYYLGVQESSPPRLG